MALSVKQPWANMIASGQKTIETRTWGTNYRGPLLIVSAKEPPVAPAGYAVAVAELVDCRLMMRADEPPACCEIYPLAYAWVLRNVRRIEPFAVRGYQRLYEVETKGRLRIMDQTAEATTTTDVAEAEDTQEILDGALIDKTTPIGRVYLFPVDFNGDLTWRFEGFAPNGETLKFSTDVGKETWVHVNSWNKIWAQTVTEVRFAESETEGGTDAEEADDDVVDEHVPEEPAPGNGETTAKQLRRIHAARKTVLRRSKIVADLRGDLKAAREDYSEAVAGLLAVIGEDPTQMPLFSGGDDAAEADAETGEVSDGRPAEGADEAAEDESWRDVPLDAMNAPDEAQIKPKYLKALADNNPPITTIGQMTDWITAKGDFWAKDVKGLGKAAADNICDAMEAFWARRKAERKVTA